MLTLLGQEQLSLNGSGGPYTIGLTIPSGTKAIVLATISSNLTGGASIFSGAPSVGGVTSTIYRDNLFAFFPDISARSNDTLTYQVVWGYCMAYYLSGTGPAYWEDATSSTFTICAAPTNGGNVFGCWVQQGYAGSGWTYYDYLDLNGSAGAGTALVGHTDVGAADEAVQAGRSGDFLYYANYGQFFVYESIVYPHLEPDPFAVAVTFAAPTVTLADDLLLYSASAQLEVVVPAPALSVPIARQLALVGVDAEMPGRVTRPSGLTTPMLSVVDGIPTFIEAPAAALDLDDLTDVDATGPSDGDVIVWDSATSTWVAEPPAPGGVTDHGGLTGLSDDDHPQYLLLTDVGTVGYWEPVILDGEIVTLDNDIIMQWVEI